MVYNVLSYLLIYYFLNKLLQQVGEGIRTFVLLIKKKKKN